MTDPLRPVPIDAMIASPSADLRVEGLDRLARDGHADLAGLAIDRLGDDAPFTFLHGDTVMIAEVRSRALVALQRLYRLTKRAPDFGPVQVRRAMPAAEAQARAAKLLGGLDDAAGRLAEAERFLSERVQPGPDMHEAVRAYRVLQDAGQVAYRTEEVDPTDWLTPLQREVSAGQVKADRPIPHLAVHDPEGRTLGFVYRNGGDRWALDFAEDASALEARQWVTLVMTTIEKDGVPRVRFDEGGAPKVNGDGSFVLDGVIPHDTDDPLGLLRSLEAFTARRYSTLLRA